MKCPVCGCLEFYVKDPDDEYETYEFELREDKVVAQSDDCPEIKDNTESFCNKCAWHGKVKELQ